MTDRPKIVIALMHNIGGLNTCIGQVEVIDDTIVWKLRGYEGEQLLDMVRADLMQAATTGRAVQFVDLIGPLQPKH